MKDFIGQVIENPSCCPSLSLKTRIIGFIITFILGIFILIMSFGALGGLFLGQVSWFAFLYTFGNLTALCSSFFLVGPKKQAKNMMDPKRLVISLIFIVSMVMTLVCAIVFNSKLLIIICTSIQFCSLVWYVLSYIPHGRALCKNCLKSCCCGNEEEGGDEKKELIV